jgi:membrane-associated phospholipid phosphatase
LIAPSTAIKEDILHPHIPAKPLHRTALVFIFCGSVVPLQAQEPAANITGSKVLSVPPQPSSNQATMSDHRFAQAASDALLPALVTGELILLSDNRGGRELATRGAGAVVTTFAATQALKYLVREKRPQREARDSFPSGHASLAFAMAATLGTYKPSYALPAYGAAATIAWSRVKLREHRWHDVVAGAALGFAIGRAFSRHEPRQQASAPAFAVGFGF